MRSNPQRVRRHSGSGQAESRPKTTFASCSTERPHMAPFPLRNYARRQKYSESRRRGNGEIDDGLERRADQILHYVTPAMFLIDWLAWVPRGRVPFGVVPAYLLYPGLYCVWMLLYGALTGWYPYPLVNAARLGSGQLVTNIVGVTAVALAIPYALLVLDRILASLQRLRIA
jgi:hypothetical protein